MSAGPTSAKDIPLVEMKGVGKTYFNGFKAVSPVSLTIYEGEFLTLLGPSGCGKTTTLRMLGGFEQPTEGSILLQGKDITQLPPNLRETNMVFQDYALFPHMSVAQNIGFGPSIARIAPEKIRADVHEMLKIVGLGDLAKRLPSELSGGQRQRVALARSLIQRPKLLLLDEPLGALDANMREQMQTELKEIQSRLGITFIMVTHDQHEALTMSDRIVVMNKGLVEQVGAVEDLYERPTNEFVANFLGTTNLLDASSTKPRRIEIAGGVTLDIGADARLGKLRVGIRPERIVPADPEQASNVFTAKAVSRTYLGNAGRLTVRIQDGPSLLVDLPIQRFSDIAIGSTLKLHVPPESVRVFL